MCFTSLNKTRSIVARSILSLDFNEQPMIMVKNTMKRVCPRFKLHQVNVTTWPDKSLITPVFTYSLCSSFRIKIIWKMNKYELAAYFCLVRVLPTVVEWDFDGCRTLPLSDQPAVWSATIGHASRATYEQKLFFSIALGPSSELRAPSCNLNITKISTTV